MAIPAPGRILELTAGAEGDDLEPRLLWFVRFLLLHLAYREVIRVFEGQAVERYAWAAGLVGFWLVSMHPRGLRLATVGAAGILLWKYLRIFPAVANHLFLELMCVSFVAWLGWQTRGAQLTLVRGLRWLPVLVLFWSGLNKVMYGTYFNGAFLATTLIKPGFAFVFSWVLPADEFQRAMLVQSPGPYEFHSMTGLVVSNLVYVGEIAAAIAILIPRLRMLGLVLALGMLIGIEVGALEIAFGLIMLNLLALFVSGQMSRNLYWVSLASYAVLLPLKLWLGDLTIN